MQTCYRCGQDVDLKQTEDGVWRRVTPGGSDHECLFQKKLRRVCSWCGKVMEQGDEGAETTHGICEGCLEGVKAEADKFWNSEAGILTRQTVEKFFAPREPGFLQGQPAASR